MKNKTLITLIIALAFFTQLDGQVRGVVEKPVPQYKHAIGMSAGFTIGYGLTYQYWIKNFGVQANFAPAVNDRDTRYTGGLSFFYKLITVEHLNLFLYQGNSYWYSKREYSSGARTTKYLNNGLGIGIEFVAIDRVGLSIMGGYATRENFDNYNLTGEAILKFKF